MKKRTEDNLKNAFAGESQAHLKYAVFADIAEREGLPNAARLFRAASYSERMHATAHLRALGGVGKTAQNLEGAFGGESFEIAEMYPAYLAVATLQEEKRAVDSMEDALAAEKVHAALYARAQEAVGASTDLTIGEIYVCPVCGFTMEGEPPEKCPQCGAKRANFHKF